MMQFALLSILLFSGVCTAQKFTAQRNNDEIVITRSENENDGAGNFKWLTELSDGTTAEQSGYIKEGPDPENPIQVINGQFSYVSPEGQQINLRYTADENGFQPEGAHLPTPPPVPEAIQKAIDLILRNAENGAPQQQQQARPAPPPQRFNQPQQPRRG